MRIFIGGPSDVRDKTKALFSLCSELKATLEIVTGQDVQVTDWSRIPPSAGNAQHTIFNESRYKDTDIFIFVFWHRFGSPPGGKSAWRIEMKKKKPHEYPTEDLQSGTEAEVELALRIAKSKGVRDRRVMIYRCVLPVPLEEIDTGQLHALNLYFKERIGSSTALWHKVTDLNNLVQRATLDILQTAQGISKLENRASRAIKEVGHHYALKEKTEDRRLRLLNKYICRECEATSDIIHSVLSEDFQACRIRTTDLYNRIVDMMADADHVRIVDLDIKRWNELINDSASLFTLNYSRKILYVTADRAKQHGGFKLQRVFVLQKGVFLDRKDRGIVIDIFNAVDKFISDEGIASHIDIRVFFKDADTNRGGTEFSNVKFRRAQDLISKVRDIVLCEADGSKILLREDMSPENPEPAFETWGEISGLPAHIEEAEGTFAAVWDIAWPLREAINKLVAMNES